MSLTIGASTWEGTKILGGASTRTAGSSRSCSSSPRPPTCTPSSPPSPAVVTELVGHHEVEAVGIGAAGYIDETRSIVRFAPNLAWRDLDLRGELEYRPAAPGRRRERRQRRRLGRGSPRRRSGRRRPAAGSRSAPVWAAGWSSTAACTAGRTASAARSGTCGWCPRGCSAAAGTHGCLEAYAQRHALVRGDPGSGPRRFPCWPRRARPGRRATPTPSPDRWSRVVSQEGRPFAVEAARRASAPGSARASPPWQPCWTPRSVVLARRGQRGGRAAPRSRPGRVRAAADRPRPPAAGRVPAWHAGQPGRPDRRR